MILIKSVGRLQLGAVMPVVDETAPMKILSDESLEGDSVQRGHRFFGIIGVDPQRMSGEPCFAVTRVPVKNLFDYLESKYSLRQFLEDFDGVTEAHAVAVIEAAQAGLLFGLLVLLNLSSPSTRR